MSSFKRVTLPGRPRLEPVSDSVSLAAHEEVPVPVSPSGRSGAAAEQSVWDAVRQKPGWSVVEGRVTVRNAAGELRVYDGAAISPRGRVIGLEVKSGDAMKTATQRAFDSGVSTINPAVGVGDDAGLSIGRTLEIRR